MEDAQTVALGIALEGASDMQGGFTAGDVAQVEAAWSLVDADIAAYGFVLRLADGERRYLELTLSDVVQRSEAEIEMRELGERDDLPDSGEAEWTLEVAHLNLRLAQLRRQ
jgi:hypothetical protein